MPNNNKLDEYAWEDFVHDFMHGRTHVLYGGIVLFILDLFLVLIPSFILQRPTEFAAAVGILLLDVAMMTDVVAHLYFH